MLPALALLLVLLALGIPVAIVGIPLTMITGDIGAPYRWAMQVIRIGLRTAGIRVDAVWKAPLDPNRRYLFFSNHVSNLDPPVLLPLLPGRTSAFVKRSLMNIPLLGYAMKLADFIPVDRGGRVESAQESVASAARALARGLHVTSFVEGTRSHDGRLLPFKKGPFYLAEETGAPVVPVSICGTETMMRKGSLRLYPATAHVIFHAPIDPADFATREDLMDAVREAIASGLPAWMRTA
jgi:1-acyl-sn-glycerol-3-phosphate acyltransferase